MWICDNCCACFRASSTNHETHKVQDCFLIGFALVLSDGELFFQILVYHEVYHCFTDAPIRSCHTLPKSSDALFKKESKTMKYNRFAILGIFFENLGYFEKCTKCSTVSPMPQYEAVTPYQKKFLARHSALIIFCT